MILCFTFKLLLESNLFFIIDELFFSCHIVVQSLSHVRLFVIPWPIAHRALLSFTISQFAQIHVHWVCDTSHPLLPLLLLPSIFPSIWSFSNELALHIRWPKYWGVSASVHPMNIWGWLSLGLTGFISLQSKGLSSLLQHHTLKASILCPQPSLWSNSHIHTWLLEKP